VTPFQPSDAELMDRTRAGDSAAFDELYRRHLDDARRVARIVCDNADEAEDVTAEAFTRVLDQLRRGGGPRGDLRPYLRTVVRRLAVDRYRSGARGLVPADPDLVDSLPAADDPIAIATNRDMMRKAYETLPPRWQEVLWRTEVEGHSPSTLAAQLGSTPNAVAALAYRAREGLRQAYLSMHAASSMRAGCKPYVPMLTALTRGTLTPGEQSTVNAHIAGCDDCRERRDEMLVLVSDLRSLLVPALLGTALTVTPAVAAVTAGGAASGSAAAGGIAANARHVRPRGSSVAGIAGAAAAVVAAAVVAAAMVSSVLSPAPDDRVSDPPIAASAPFDDAQTGVPTPSPVATPDAESAEPEAAVTQPEPEATAPVPADPEPPPVETPAPDSTPEEPAPPPPDDRDEPEPTGEPDPQTTSDPSPAPPTATRRPSLVARDVVTPTPGTSPPVSSPSPPASPSPSPSSPPSSDAPPWLCRLIPAWPGCPDDPQRPVRDAVCARMPELPWCP
jgi:RNA polymerase sigma factor (sigma-70 family)